MRDEKLGDIVRYHAHYDMHLVSDTHTHTYTRGSRRIVLLMEYFLRSRTDMLEVEKPIVIASTVKYNTSCTHFARTPKKATISTVPSLSP